MIEEQLGARTLVLQLPIGRESTFIGVVDLLVNETIVSIDDLGTIQNQHVIPEEMREEAAKDGNPELDRKLEERAEQEIRLYLVLEKLAQELKTEPSREEVEAELERFMKRESPSGREEEDSRQEIEDRVIQRLKREKAVQLLLDKSIIEEKEEEGT